MSNTVDKSKKLSSTSLRDPNVILEERIARFKKAFEAQTINLNSRDRR